MRKKLLCGTEGKVLLRWIFVNYIFNKCQSDTEAFLLSQSFILFFCILQSCFRELFREFQKVFNNVTGVVADLLFSVSSVDVGMVQSCVGEVQT